jgi:hypothetical protein
MSVGEVNNPLDISIIQNKRHNYTKSIEGQHGPPTKAKVGSGAMEE